MFCVADTTTRRSSQVLIGAELATRLQTGTLTWNRQAGIHDTKHAALNTAALESVRGVWCLEERSGSFVRFIRIRDSAVSGCWAAGMSSRFYLRSTSWHVMTEDPRLNEIISESKRHPVSGLFKVFPHTELMLLAKFL